MDLESTVSLVYSCGSRLPSLRAVSPGWRAARGPCRGVPALVPPHLLS